MSLFAADVEKLARAIEETIKREGFEFRPDEDAKMLGLRGETPYTYGRELIENFVGEIELVLQPRRRSPGGL